MPPTDLSEYWGRRLRARRKALGITPTDLAQTCGITRQSVHYYEAGDRVPSDHVRIRLAQALDTTVPELFPHDLPAPEAVA